MFCVSPMVTTHTHKYPEKLRKRRRERSRSIPIQKFNEIGKRTAREEKMGKKATVLTENSERNASNDSFPFDHYFKCKWIKLLS